MKPLSEMTLEELWQLFPIVLTEPKDEWRAWYGEQRALLVEILPCARISHIGSTAINGIWAKPTVDILVEIADDADWRQAAQKIVTRAGYTRMSRGENRESFNKGYTPQGFAEKVFHLHLRRMGDNDELYFRDYLNEHADVAAEYERLKLALWKRLEHDRDGYTAAKGEFVARYTKIARQQYAGRY